MRNPCYQDFSDYAAEVAKCLPARLYADLVGKPFAAGGRGPDVFDCVGLAAEIQRRRGLAVPVFSSSEAELHRQIAAGGFLADCQRVRKPEPGCVALLKMGLHEHHLGTMVSQHRILHTTAQTRGVVVESILGPLFKNRILGFYLLASEPASQRVSEKRFAPGLGAYSNGDEGARP